MPSHEVILWCLIGLLIEACYTQLNSNTNLLTDTKRKIPKLVQLYVFTSFPFQDTQQCMQPVQVEVLANYS